MNKRIAIVPRLFLFLLMIVISGNLFAYDFKVDGLCYNVLSESEKTVELTWEAENIAYTGDVVVPSVVANNGSIYTVIKIGERAFCYISGINVLENNELRSVTIPNSIRSIDDNAFFWCTGLTSFTIPNGVLSIGNAAFGFCGQLSSITIPNSVTSIGDGIFRGSSNLASINVEVDNKYYDSRGNCNAIINSSTNTLIAGCKNTIIPNSVTSIGEKAFFICTYLTSVTIPNSVLSIGNTAFGSCYNLRFLTIPNSVNSIGEEAFSGCSGLTSITVEDGNRYYDSRNGCNAIINSSTNELIIGCKNTIIPNSVRAIGANAFNNCTGLTSVTIPNNVTAIGDYAFNNCTHLTSVIIPNGVETIGRYAFAYCI